VRIYFCQKSLHIRNKIHFFEQINVPYLDKAVNYFVLGIMRSTYLLLSPKSGKRGSLNENDFSTLIN